MRKHYILRNFVLVGVLSVLHACALEANNTPEKTIDAFVEGYRRGDEFLIFDTVMGAFPPPVGSGRPEKYEIIEKLLVLESVQTDVQAGDIEIRTHRVIQDPNGTTELLATFRLRKSNGEWKIIEYVASSTDSLPPD